MKAERLIIKNIGLISSETIPLNKPLILFYGQIRQGKTTVLNAVRWVFGGPFPQSIIKEGCKEAAITLETDNGTITRTFTRSGDETKAKEITFIRDGKIVPKPVTEIKKFLNPFLIDQDHLRNMGEIERKRFFTELFNVDTSDLDSEMESTKTEAQELRAKIRAYGDIDLTKVEPVDVGELERKISEVKHKELETRKSIERQNAVIRKDNEASRFKASTINALNAEIIELRSRLANAESKVAQLTEELTPIRNEITTPEPMDVSAWENKLRESLAVNEKYAQYKANLERQNQRTSDEKLLSSFEGRLREIRDEKIARLQTVTTKCGIEGLSFDDEGNFTYQGTQAGMLSTSQLMKLSSELSALYPEGFGLDLIDRAESLGRSIFEFIQKAKAENKTILATVVGEKPADIPESVGVFVVNNGKLTKG